VIPPTDVAAIVPDPEVAKLAPVPITMAAEVFVLDVIAEKATAGGTHVPDWGV